MGRPAGEVRVTGLWSIANTTQMANVTRIRPYIHNKSDKNTTKTF